MQLLRSIIFASVVSGTITGAAVSGIQAFSTTPLILKAETYEDASGVAPHSEGVAVAETQPHSHEGAQAAHVHSEEEWAPADGLERFFYTVAANVLVAIGFAMALTALMSMRSKTTTVQDGVLWGAAAFISLMLAPSVGLPPELPGSAAGPLLARQVWWIATACATASAIALIFFRREWWGYAAALVLVIAPHIVGAPQAALGETSLAPESLEAQFIVSALVTNLLFWLILGSISAFLFQRMRHAEG